MGSDFEKDSKDQSLLEIFTIFALSLFISWLCVSFGAWLFCWVFGIPYLMIYGFKAWILYMLWVIIFKQRKGGK